MIYFVELDKTILKVIWKSKGLKKRTNIFIGQF